jgi:hypothetical protein
MDLPVTKNRPARVEHYFLSRMKNGVAYDEIAVRS